jgi:hypothetical protein
LPGTHYIATNNKTESRIQLNATPHVHLNRDPGAALVLTGAAVLEVETPPTDCVGLEVARVEPLVTAAGVCVELVEPDVMELELVTLAVGVTAPVDVESTLAELEPELATVGAGNGEVTHSGSMLNGTCG